MSVRTCGIFVNLRVLFRSLVLKRSNILFRLLQMLTAICRGGFSKWIALSYLKVFLVLMLFLRLKAQSD